jgi:hypothetical protein
MKIRSLLTIVIAFTLIGCADSKPSEADARQKLERQIQEESGGLIKLVSFRKTDGAGHGIMGKNEVNYTAEIEFRDDLFWGGCKQSEGCNFHANSIAPAQMAGLILTGQQQKKGDRFTFSGTLALEKTESGWR